MRTTVAPTAGLITSWTKDERIRNCGCWRLFSGKSASLNTEFCSGGSLKSICHNTFSWSPWLGYPCWALLSPCWWLRSLCWWLLSPCRGIAGGFGLAAGGFGAGNDGGIGLAAGFLPLGGCHLLTLPFGVFAAHVFACCLFCFACPCNRCRRPLQRPCLR